MSLPLRWLASLVMAGGACMAQQEAANARQSLTDLQSARADTPAVQQDLEILSRAFDADALWPEIDRVFQSKDVPLSIRAELLQTVASQATAAVTEKLVAAGNAWLARIEVDQAQAWDEMRLLSILMSSASQPPLSQHWSQSESALLLTRDVIVTAPQWMGLALGLFESSTVSASVKEQAALSTITRRQITEVEPAIMRALQEGSFQQLRAMVAAPDGSIHFGAAAALAEIGDEASLAPLRAAHAKYSSQDPNAAGYITNFIWKIEIQHPRERLVEFIAQPMDDPRWTWALRRAVELGIDTERLRTAVLAHVAGLPTKKFTHPMTKRTKVMQPGAVTAKSEGTRLQVLRPGDLPKITVPEPPTE